MSEKDKYDFSKIFDKVLNRSIHKRLTKDLIANTLDTDLPQLIVDNIEVNNKRKSDGEIYSCLTRGQKGIYSTYILETQVFNGGFEGFYLNTNCELNQFIEGDLAILDAKSFADIVARANKLNETEPTNLFSLDNEFHKLVEIDNLDVRRTKYIRNNITEFIAV
jgi:hypothetical protein